jgi:transcription factor S
LKEKQDKKPKLFTVKYCPRCGSDEVYWAQGMPQLWSVWDCHNCGYRGPVILEDGNMAMKLQADWKTKQDNTAES